MGLKTMTSCSETEDDQFFDTRDEVSSMSDLASECSDGFPSNEVIDDALAYDFWTKKPNSVRERRDSFLKLMGLSVHTHNGAYGAEVGDLSHEEPKRDFNRFLSGNEAVLANFDSAPVENGVTEDNAPWKIKNLDNGTEFIVDKQDEDGSVTTFRELGSDKMISADELQKTFGSSELVQELLRKDSKVSNEIVCSKKKSKSSWLQRFMTKGSMDKSNETSSKVGSGVRVRVSKKHTKELSALHVGQEFPAHEGSILTMKFSPDGRHLASGGVDGVVRVWNVLEDDNVNKFNAHDLLDPSGLFFYLDHVSKVAPMSVVKENSSASRMSSDPDPVVLPRKVFQLSEKPLHEFRGHEGEVLCLSWSKNGCLLSSSVDKTVCLWRVGYDRCIRAYFHNNYVTCVDFNPVDDNRFISGSIDGKLRIWEIDGGRVIDWTDIKGIVTAVCYSPDGKGGIAGSMDGNCRFYEVVDDRLELGDQMCLKGKKKLPGKRITGFQYCPGDISKVMVTSADSQVRIICGTDVVCKFKGYRSSGTQSPASFTSDGNHVVSIGEDSNVRVWSYEQKSKKVGSCESFPSRNSSVAVPWGGVRAKLAGHGHGHVDEVVLQKLSAAASIPDRLSFFIDALHNYKGVPPSWPRLELKVVRNGWVSALNHHPNLWGLVIVTAGWDGCIRTFLNYGFPIPIRF